MKRNFSGSLNTGEEVADVSKAELHLSKRDRIPHSVLWTGQLAIMENLHFKHKSLIGLDVVQKNGSTQGVS